MSDKSPKNPLRRHGKQPVETTLGIVAGFVRGEPIKACATRMGTTPRTVRDTYAALRDRLLRPAFARWHPRNVSYTRLDAQAAFEKRWDKLMDTLATCYGDLICRNNFQNNKRAGRLCTSCPLLAEYGDDAQINEMIHLADSAREFYAALGWRTSRSGKDPASEMEKMIVHQSILHTALKYTPEGFENGVDMSNDEPLFIGRVYTLLLEDLTSDPL